MFLQKFGEDFVFALELLFECGDLLVLGVVGGGLGAGGLEGGGTLLEEGFLPLVELGDGDAGLGADLGDGLGFEQVLPQDRDFGDGREVPSFGCTHDGPPEWSVVTSTATVNFQFQLRQNRTSSIPGMGSVPERCFFVNREWETFEFWYGARASRIMIPLDHPG